MDVGIKPESRRYAILHEGGPVLVLAGPAGRNIQDHTPVTVIDGPGGEPYELTDGDVLKYATRDELLGGDTLGWLTDEFEMAQADADMLMDVPPAEQAAALVAAAVALDGRFGED